MDKESLVLRILSDPIRLRLTALLAAEGEMCVCRLVSVVDRPQYAVSRQLGLMRAAGLVETRRQGRWMYYRLAEPNCPLQTHLYALFASGLDGHPVLLSDRQALGQFECTDNGSAKEH